MVTEKYLVSKFALSSNFSPNNVETEEDFYVQFSHNSSYGEEQCVILDSPEKTAVYKRLGVFAADATQTGLVRRIITNNSAGREPINPNLVIDMRIDRPGYSRKYGKLVFLDGPHALVLEDSANPGRPLAVAGLQISPQEIVIRQIQGIKGQEDKLKQIGRWEKSLVSLVEEAARTMGVSRVRVVAARQNGWVSSRIRLGLMDENSAKLRYDVTAKRMGYRWDKTQGNWVKELGTI